MHYFYGLLYAFSALYLVILLWFLLMPKKSIWPLKQVYGTVYDRYKAGTARFFVCL